MRGFSLGTTTLGLAAAAMLVLGAAQAGAESRSFEQARRAYGKLEYAKVTPLLEKALQEASDPREQVAILELLATMHVMYGRTGEATATFVRVLTLEPNYLLPQGSAPKISAAFEAALKIHPREVAAPPPAAAAVVPPASDAGPPRASSLADQPRIPEVTVTGPSIFERWWFWAAVGAVAVTATGVGVWAASKPEYPQTDIGPLRVP